MERIAGVERTSKDVPNILSLTKDITRSRAERRKKVMRARTRVRN